jgi:hypothetical protein
MKTIKMEQCQFCDNMFGDIKMLRQHQKKTKYCLKIQEKLTKEREEASAKESAELLTLQSQTKELTCQFCNKQCKTKYILNNHQTQAKYCLKIQESQNSQKIISSILTCKYCEKKISSGNFNRHNSICKKKMIFFNQEIDRIKAEKDQEIALLKAEKDQEITKLKDEKVEIYKNIAENFQAAAERANYVIEEIAKKPTYQKTTTKNIQNNLMISQLTPLNLTKPSVESVIDSNYTSNDFYGGQKGAAQMIYKHFVTDDNGKSKIICTDMKQGAFHHKNSNGEHIIDYNNSHLIKTVHAPLKKKACEIAAKELVKNPDMMKEINKNSTSISELTSRPGVFNTAMAEMTGKNSARELLIEKISSEHNLSITEEWLLENAKFLTIDHILRGPEGYADYALSYPLNDRLIEEEYLETTFIKYKDRLGNIIIDYGGKMLTKMIFDSVKDRTYELINSNDNVIVEYGDIEDFNFQEEFINIVMSNI